jgi:general secretion pathway protein K
MKSRVTEAQKGLALFVVIWVIAILMVTALSFSFLTHTETYATRGFKESAGKKFLAEAGVDRGVIEILYRKANLNNPLIQEGSEPWKADGTLYKEKAGDGYYTVSIVGEAGKIDINKAPDVLLKNLLLNTGISEEQADSIVDCIMDWKDPSGLTRLHGAGNDYYQALPVPYSVKGAYFDTLEELLLVKGVTPDLLYGDGSHKGIIDFLTVKSGIAQINLNYAPKEVLMAIPGMTPDVADNIIQFRQTQTITDPAEAMPGANYQVMQPFIASSGEGTVFSIDATGYEGNEKSGYPVKAIVNIDSDSAYRYLYYKSPQSRGQ